MPNLIHTRPFSYPNIFALLIASFLSLSVSCSVLQGKSTPAQYANDANITTQVKARLAQSDMLPALNIHVETQNGIVQMSGFVSNHVQVGEAQRIASAVPEVRGIINDIVVMPPKVNKKKS